VSKDSKIPGAFPYSGEGDEMNYSKGMTLRQYAAIHLKVPNSGTDWLDEMIKKSAQYGIIEYSIEETTAGDPSDAK
jgi:hypothetical protein